MHTVQMEAASVVVFPFVQCELVAPLVVDGSPDTKSSCSVGVNGFTGSGFTCICSEELVLVLCGARIGGHCGWPQCLGPAPVFGAGSSVWGRLQFKVPLHMLGSTFVTTPFNPGNVATGSSPVGSLITPYVRGVFRGWWVGGRAGCVETESAIE